MKALASLLLALAAAQLVAAEIAWDWPYTDERVTYFRIDVNGAEVARTDDATARSVDIGDTLQGGETITGFACSEQACSPPSDPLWIPNGMSNIRVTWGLQ